MDGLWDWQFFPFFCKHESENCKTQKLKANSRLNCRENVNAEHPKSLLLLFSHIFLCINVKDGEPQVIVNLLIFVLVFCYRGLEAL
jgi:hypothetical protein